MKAFIITQIILAILSAEITLGKQPGKTREPDTAGGLLFRATVSAAMAAWGIYVLL